ncbi:MAG: tRNA preQ1(34) S-adenosylmethionine ribosyltransferase-isomerase QueA [Deltaproteobacteria bacterium]|nr:tRNA preQ1(34) S-adenosylmethionine ribosyltransferase-isomerase QueA [Deltaproteobacteria bacterium]
MFAPSDYDFELPDALIAQQPAATREASRLLHVRPDGSLGDHTFADIVELLPRDAVVIANDTRVIPARVPAVKSTGGKVELLFLEPVSVEELGSHARYIGADRTPWRCLLRGRVNAHDVFVDGEPISIIMRRSEGGALPGSVVVAVPGDGYAFLDRHGHMPLPPYIDREDALEDRDRYQTMFAQAPGAVASPTAGLHMTPAIAEAMRSRGIALATVTLHVGWGTFAPIRVDDVREHKMHRERYVISADTAALVASGRPIVALGTTAMRALESAATAPLGTAPAAPRPETAASSPRPGTAASSPRKALTVGSGATELFVHPGSNHTFQIVDHLITNFHLPKSTLLMLVSAFAGTERVLAAYEHAVAQRYRFFSYGDAMLCHLRA